MMTTAKRGWTCWSRYVLVETPEANLSRGMRQLNGVYTQHINRTHGRVGHLYQGRYTGILVESEPYLLEVARYVVLSPVRAGLVGDAGAWDWSSYRAMVGEAACPDWLERQWLVGRFAKRRSVAIRRYMDFVREGVGQPSLWDALQRQVFLGGEQFVERMKARLPDTDLREVPRAQRRPSPQALESFTDTADPHAGMVAAYRTGGYTMKEIADAFGVHYARNCRVARPDPFR